MEDRGRGDGGHQPKSFPPGSIRRGCLRHGSSPGPFLLLWGAHAQPGTTTGRLKRGLPKSVSTLASSLPSLCLSFPACEGLGLLLVLRNLHIALSLPWAALGLGRKLCPNTPPPRISGLIYPESHLGSPRSKSPHGFLQGGETPLLTPLSTRGSPPLFLDSVL